MKVEDFDMFSTSIHRFGAVDVGRCVFKGSSPGGPWTHDERHQGNCGERQFGTKHRLPKQRKTQRTKLALLVSTMLEVRSATLMDLAAGLPRDADRTDMRYQWIIRLLGNPLVISDAVMEPFAREVLERAAADGEPLSLILDQSKMSDRHQVLMLAVRWGRRPCRWPGGSRRPRARSGSTPSGRARGGRPLAAGTGRGPAAGRPLLSVR